MNTTKSKSIILEALAKYEANPESLLNKSWYERQLLDLRAKEAYYLAQAEYERDVQYKDSYGISEYWTYLDNVREAIDECLVKIKEFNNDN